MRELMGGTANLVCSKARQSILLPARERLLLCLTYVLSTNRRRTFVN